MTRTQLKFQSIEADDGFVPVLTINQNNLDGEICFEGNIAFATEEECGNFLHDVARLLQDISKARMTDLTKQ